MKHEHDEFKKKLNAMSSDNNRLQSNLNQFDGKDKQQRMRIEELSRQMAESLEKLRAASKEKVMKRKIRFNWIIKSKMKIAGSLIDGKILRVSLISLRRFVVCRRTFRQSWKRRGRFAAQRSAPFKSPQMSSPKITRRSGSMRGLSRN